MDPHTGTRVSETGLEVQGCCSEGLSAPWALASREPHSCVPWCEDQGVSASVCLWAHLSREGVLAARWCLRRASPGGVHLCLDQGLPWPPAAQMGWWSAREGGFSHACGAAAAGSSPAPHPAQTRAPSSSSLPTRQRVGRKTSGPRQRGFWQRGQKVSGNRRPIVEAAPALFGVEAARPPSPRACGTSQAFRGLWPFDSQSKASYTRR